MYPYASGEAFELVSEPTDLSLYRKGSRPLDRELFRGITIDLVSIVQPEYNPLANLKSERLMLSVVPFFYYDVCEGNCFFYLMPG